jgi:hypothetical protein
MNSNMKKQKKVSDMKRRDFLKASAVAVAAGAGVSLEGTRSILEGAEGKKVYVVPNVTTPNRPVIRNPDFRYIILIRRIGIFS